MGKLKPTLLGFLLTIIWILFLYFRENKEQRNSTGPLLTEDYTVQTKATSPFLLIAVISSAANFEARMNIREAWLRKKTERGELPWPRWDTSTGVYTFCFFNCK